MIKHQDGISACLSKAIISAKPHKGSTVSARFTGTFSITIISCADEHSSVTIASMVTSPLPAKKQKQSRAKKVAAPAKEPPKKREQKKKTKEAPIKPWDLSNEE